MVEPGPYATNWLDTGSTNSTEIPDYDAVRTALSRGWDADAVGDPFATRVAILAVVDARKPPLRVFFGKNQLADVTADYQARLATWHEWQPISAAAFRH